MTTRLVLAVVALALMRPAELRAQSILTIAGGATDDGRPATLARLGGPTAVAVDASGTLYIAEANRVRKVAAGSGIITTIAGNGSRGFSGDGGPATMAALDGPWSVAIDFAGNVYFTERFNDRIRKVSAGSGIITTVAGSGSGAGFGGDDGPATAAKLSRPQGVALDSRGNVYIADVLNDRVRRVSADTGIITTFAGKGVAGFGGDFGTATAALLSDPTALTFDSEGNLYIADDGNHRIRKVDRNGIITTVAGFGESGFSGDGGHALSARISYSKGVTVDAGGNLFITTQNRVRRVASGSGIITTVAGNGAYEFGGDGGSATAAGLRDPHGVTNDSAGNLYVADYGNGRIRRITADSNIIMTIAGSSSAAPSGDGGPATAASLFFPSASSVDAVGNLYIAERGSHRIRKVARGGNITTVAGNGAHGFSGDGGAATDAGLSTPLDVALDVEGNLYVSDSGNRRIRRIDARSGIITTVAGGGTLFEDGIPATTAFVAPHGVVLDSAGNLYFADASGDGSNGQRVRKVSAGSGTVTTVARADFFGLQPEGLAFDSAGNLYVADSNNGWIRKIDLTTGTMTTVAGYRFNGFNGDVGPATSTQLDRPSDVAVDSNGALYIADTANSRIRRVAAGYMTTVAGSQLEGVHGDGGPATAAGLASPRGVALDAAGNLYITEQEGQRIRAVFACVEIAPSSLTSPSNGSSGVSTSPRLSWETVKGAFRYDVYLDTVSPPRTIIASDITTINVAPANLEPASKYYWKVVAKGDPFCKPFRTAESPVWTFTTSGTCEAPGAIP